MSFHFDTKIKVKLALAALLLVAFNFGFVQAVMGDAATDQLNAQQQANQAKLNQINQQVKQFQQQVAQTKQKSASLANEISIYDNQIASTELEIQAKTTQIEDANLQIKALQSQIDQKKSDIAQNREILGELMLELNQYDGDYALKTTLGSDNLSDFLDQIQYAQTYQDKIFQLTQKIKDLEQKLETQQKDLKIQVANLEELKKQLQITQDSLSSQKDQKQTLLTQTRGLEKNYQRLLSSSEQDQANLQKEINDLDSQIRSKLGTKRIAASKGILEWPIDGVITQGYGNTGFTALGYNFHNGIDVAAPAAAPIYAAADGVVLATDQSDTVFGNWVAIRHNLQTKKGPVNIVTLYGHFRSFIVHEGQVVKQGDLIGYEGNTGNTSRLLYGPERGYHVHFGVYDADGFTIKPGAYPKVYGPYKVPGGYTYNPLDFLQ